MHIPEDEIEEAKKLLKQMEYEISTRSQEIVTSSLKDSLDIMQRSIDVILNKIDMVSDDELATKLTRSVGVNMAGMMQAIAHLKKEISLLNEKGFSESISKQKPKLN